MDDRELLLLGLLSQNAMHGYQLNTFLEERLGAVIPLNRSTAYFLLNRMADNDLVIASEEYDEGTHRNRRVYQITEKGQAAFEAGLRDHLQNHHPVLNRDAVGILFLDALDPADQQAALQRRLDALQVRGAELTEQLRKHEATMAEGMISLQLAHVEADERWVRNRIEQIAHRAQEVQ